MKKNEKKPAAKPEKKTADNDVTAAMEEFNRLLREEMAANYSETALEHLVHPKNQGPLEGANAGATVQDEHGDIFELQLRIDDDRITGAAFLTKGCLTMRAVGSGVTEYIRGMEISRAIDISEADVLGFMGKIPPQTEHCITLAIQAVREAVAYYFISKNMPGNGTDFKSVRIDL